MAWTYYIRHTVFHALQKRKQQAYTYTHLHRCTDSTPLHYGAVLDFQSSMFYVTEVPYPLKKTWFPTSIYQEPLLVDFFATFYLSRLVNIIISFLGLVFVIILLYRYRKTRLISLGGVGMSARWEPHTCIIYFPLQNEDPQVIEGRACWWIRLITSGTVEGAIFWRQGTCKISIASTFRN